MLIFLEIYVSNDLINDTIKIHYLFTFLQVSDFEADDFGNVYD